MLKWVQITKNKNTHTPMGHGYSWRSERDLNPRAAFDGLLP